MNFPEPPPPPQPPPRRDSPYTPPEDFEPQYGESNWEEARSEIEKPAIILMIMSALAFMYTLVMWFFSLFAPATSPEDLLNDPSVQELFTQLPPEIAEMYENMLHTMLNAGPLLNGIHLIAAGLTFYGAMKMRNLSHYGLALTSAILALIPCTGTCCCCIEMPVAIWALILLTKDHIRSAFP